MFIHDEMGGVHDENRKLAVVQEGSPGAPLGATERPSKAVRRVGGSTWKVPGDPLRNS